MEPPKKLLIFQKVTFRVPKIKKPTLKKCLIFQKMQISRPKPKKLLIFQGKTCRTRK